MNYLGHSDKTSRALPYYGHIYTHNKVHEIKSIPYLVMAEDRMNSLSVSNQRAITSLLTLCLLVPHADNLRIQF